MGRGRRKGSGLSSIAVAIGIAVASAHTSAAPLLPGPSLRETGRVGEIPLVYAALKGAGAPEHSGDQPTRDPVVHPRTAERERPGAGSLSAAIIAHELEKPVEALQDCRIDVARQQRRTWNAVAAGRVTLLWTILPAGTVAHVDVVPIDPLDLHVLECVKRAMARWTFARPRGGNVKVTASFAFR